LTSFRKMPERTSRHALEGLKRLEVKTMKNPGKNIAASLVTVVVLALAGVAYPAEREPLVFGSPAHYSFITYDGLLKTHFLVVGLLVFLLAVGSIWLFHMRREMARRRDMEKKLTESEEKFRHIIEHAPIGIFKRHIKGPYQYINPHLLKQFGCTTEEEYMKTYGAISQRWAHPERHDDFMSLLIKDRYVFDYEVESTLVDGTEKWFSIYAFMDESDQFINGFSIDISDRKRADRELNNSVAFRKRLFDTSRVPIVVLDLETTRYVDCNQAAVDIYRYSSRDEVLGKKPLDFSAPFQYDGSPSAEKALYYIEKAREDGAVVFEWRHLRPDGEVWDAEVHLMCFKSDQRWFLQFTLQDITGRKRAEEALRIEKEFNQTLVRLSPAFFVAIGADGRTIMMNESMLRALGYSENEVVGKDYMTLFVPPEDREPLYRIFKQIVEKRENTVNVNRLTARDGHELICEWHGIPVFRGEQYDFFLGVGIDVTERTRAEKELKRYQQHLETLVEERTVELQLARDAADAANRIKSMFLSNMSHEIRTPMNAVLGFAQLLERDPSLSAAARDKVATILKSGDHLLAIINDILEISRIEAGRVEVRTESFDLHGLLDDLAVMFRMRCEEKGLLFVLEKAQDLPGHIVADLGKLRQILVNLLGNAVKYTQEGSVLLRALPVGGGRIAVEVRDSGIGIRPEEMEKLFHPFERTRAGEMAAGGTGLGLAISREYARLMGGEIRVESRIGEGSCFRLEFPAQETTASPPSAGSPRRITGLSPGQGEIRVLVVDDLATNRLLLGEMLKPLGFNVDEAEDGNEAVEKARILKPHIVLMDLIMPGMNGDEATRIIRRTYPDDPPVIIGITASAFEDAKQLFLDTGITAYIAKPFRLHELYDTLTRHAGVVFESVSCEESASRSKSHAPALDKMPAEWIGALDEALARNNITRLRKLADEARKLDPDLAEWMQEKASQYDLEELKKVTQ
jgi:PAS domain S-box-containing protein